MSTRIDKLVVKKLDNFIVPLLETSTLFDDGAEILEYSPLRLKFSGGSEMGEIVGTVVDSNRIMLESLDWGGEASGSRFDQFELLLSRSTGTMKAVIVWEEAGIDRLIVVDGQVSIYSIDLGDLV